MASECNDKDRRQSCASHKDSNRIVDKMTRLSVPSIKTAVIKTKNGDKSAEINFPCVKKLIRQYDNIVEKKEECLNKSSSDEGSFDLREFKVNLEYIKQDLKGKISEDDDNSMSSVEYRNPSPKTRRIRGRTKSLKEYFSGQGLLTRGVSVYSYVDLPKHFDGVLNDKCRSSRRSKRYETRSYSDSNIGRKGSVVPLLPRLDSGTSDMSLEGIPVTFDSWSDSTSITSGKNLKRRASATPLSLSPAVSTPSGSIENFRLTKSASCGILSFPSDGEWKRSNSSDSAVVVEDECKYTDDSSVSMTSAGASIKRDSQCLKESPFLSNDFWNSNFARSTPLDGDSQKYCESEDYTEKDEYIVLRRSTTRTQRNPSVVISDHSGHSVSVHVAYASEDFSLNNLGSTPDLLQDDYCIPRRKASDCSLCSAFGPGDMEYCICYGSSEAGIDNVGQRRLSDCSTCSYLTASEDEVEVSLEEPQVLRKNSNWRKVRNVVQWSPFIQTYKRHKYPWVQLAGHQGNFKAGNKQGTIMKKLCQAEEVAFEKIQNDYLRPFVPEYLGIVDGSDGEKYLQLQDLLSDFSSACVMDIKMGVRTYLEEELAKARHKPKLRKDMYEKMIQIDSNAPSEAENRAKAVTKPRYMVWRETISSTATLGFRIEGIRRGDGTSSKDFKTTRTRDQVMIAISGFVDGYPDAVINYINRLKEIRTALEKSKFFKNHELIGSSLLFVHNEEKSGIWLIDFAKTVPLPDSVSISHREPWVEGTHEDGYLIGLDNLINLLEKLHMKQPVLKAKDNEVSKTQIQESISERIGTSNPSNTEGHQKTLPNITEEKRVSESEIILCNNLEEKELLNEEDRDISAGGKEEHVLVKKTSKNVTNVIERKVLDETRN